MNFVKKRYNRKIRLLIVFPLSILIFFAFYLCRAQTPEEQCESMSAYLNSRNHDERQNVLTYLHNIKPSSLIDECDIKILEEATFSNDKELVTAAIDTIAKYDKYKLAISPMITKFITEISVTDFRLVDAVVQMGPVAMKEIITAAQEGNLRQRTAAITALGGFPADVAMPVLLKCLEVKNLDLKKVAAEAIVRTNPPNIDFLKQLMLSSDFDEQFMGQIIAAGLAPRTIPLLFSLLNEQTDEDLREEVLRTFQMMQEKATPEVIKALIAIINNKTESFDIRTGAARALRDIGPKVVPYILPELKAALASNDESMIHWFTLTTWYIGPESKILVPVILPYLESESESTRIDLVRLLGRIDKNNKKLDQIAINDPSEKVRAAALSAINN